MVNNTSAMRNIIFGSEAVKIAKTCAVPRIYDLQPGDIVEFKDIDNNLSVFQNTDGFFIVRCKAKIIRKQIAFKQDIYRGAFAKVIYTTDGAKIQPIGYPATIFQGNENAYDAFKSLENCTLLVKDIVKVVDFRGKEQSIIKWDYAG